MIDIPDAKASSLMDVLSHISYVKAQTIVAGKATQILDVHEAVEELKLIKSGKKKARSIDEFLDEV